MATALRDPARAFHRRNRMSDKSIRERPQVKPDRRLAIILDLQALRRR
jgi:hypothetical protein